MLDERETIGHGDLGHEKLVEANINPKTGLATDYLNHFNEVVMLLELLCDMPECIPDVLAWQPLSYADHFMNSNFAAKELAVRAYNAAPTAERGTFDTITAEMNSEIHAAQCELEEAEPDQVGEIATEVANRLKPLIAEAGGVIHGNDTTPSSEGEAESESSQADIDALFA
ncbi:hypothetical protein C8N35_101237 [Breoghania corrubedonensis]|uniref:Uncharacterized protein n=1 Tax=Breoghania corrubedonensis TaxID=665038 RepID=A0A2T5VEM5_9HYPH|nr:hypothetical protein [Breoghania corrubedonensis]PTW62200.1 hypothetical protein C8N35_101237 [Breoghania corrubedonensis]